MDARAITSMLGRVNYARSIAFPSAEYMQRKYADEGPRWLPYLYVRRAVGALVKAMTVR
jgi:hypothetical protein